LGGLGLIRFLLLDVLIACILEIAFGQPKGLPHPLRALGGWIKKWEVIFLDTYGNRFLDPVKTLSRTVLVKTKRGRRYQKTMGALTLFVVLSTVFILVWFLLFLSMQMSLKLFSNRILFHILNVYFIYASLSQKSLAKGVLNVFRSLDDRNLFEARRHLNQIVGWETERLTEAEMVKVSIESTAENTLHGIVNPIFYALLGSFIGMAAPLCFSVKALHLLSSMLDRESQRHEDFGVAPSHAYNAISFITARLTGLLIVGTAFLTKFDGKSSFMIMIRDRKKTKGPNAGYPKGAFAGALQVSLGGPSESYGKLVENPMIGDGNKDIIKNDVMDGVRLMVVTFFFGALVLLGAFSLVAYLVGRF
jgi:adenosylcobinamide-phosphate synthase